jgi:NADH-quinone oxidoreductase subunit M
MILPIILLVPLLSGLCLLLFRKQALIRSVALAATLVNLLLSIPLALSAPFSYSLPWLSFMGFSFSLGYDGISLIMVLLTNLLFPFIILAGFGTEQKQSRFLHALILFTQAALLGVFLARNAFLFYVFWELALIPVYFILLNWGGRGRRAITLKFFIYTLTGSLFLLFGIIYLYQLTPVPHTLDFSALSRLNIPDGTQKWLFWILFIAFAVKMPVFPFHTWQPPTYTMASTQGVMILAGAMTKMGIYGALRLLFPVVPQGVLFWQNLVIIMCLTGMVYASVISFRQTNLKRLIAYSSMAHISLMAAAMFALNYFALQGLLLQSLSHGATIIALFFLVSVIQEKTGTVELPELGGIKLRAPNLAILFLIFTLGSIALPLTAGFIGEFLMITGLFGKSVWFALFGGLTLILGAVYMLYAYQRAMLGDHNVRMTGLSDIGTREYLILIPLIVVILALGVYPQPVLNLVTESACIIQNLCR